MGVKFQQSPDQKPSQVILHVKMLDSTNLQQQEVLGILGINLTYACYHYSDDIPQFLDSLVDSDIQSRIEINLIRFEGPLFEDVDPVHSNLSLLQKGIAKAVLFPFEKQPSYLGEELYNKQVIIHRGDFSPPIKTDNDMLRSARDHYCGSKKEGLCDPYLINEIHFNEKSDLKDIQQRVESLAQCQQHVLVTGFDHAYELSEYLGAYSTNHLNFVYRTSRLVRLMEEERIVSLERLARVFNENTRIYIYPSPSQEIAPEFHKNPDNKTITLSDYKPSDKNKLLFEHLVLAGYVQELTNFKPELANWTGSIFNECKKADKDQWQDLVPDELR